jgi:hypothetical protein
MTDHPEVRKHEKDQESVCATTDHPDTTALATAWND